MKYFVLILSILFLFPFCSSKRVKPSVDGKLSVEELPSQESWNSIITFSDSGKISAILYAGHLRKYDDKKETFLDQNIKVDFYDQNEVQTTTLTSVKGRVDETTNNLYAMDSVVVSSDSVTIKTDEMMWRNKDRKIVSDKFVTVISPQEEIQGYGFESDQNLNNYVIYNITYVTRPDSTK
ncbi:MAG: LPS export ABC transporter periplasmic protein LptC [Ignavibacteriales bacterium]|nr:LPS export ABC transporter periplasmic protein LptC [Ignavibacteriales bacterium]